MCQVPATGAPSIFIFPSPGVHGVRVCIHWQTSSWTSEQIGVPQVGAEVSGGWRIHAGIQGTHDCGVPVGLVCECCVCAASTELDQWVSRGPVGWVRGPGCGQGCRVNKGAVPVLRGSTNVRVCVLVNLKSVVSVPALVTSCLCQPKKRRRLGCLCLCFM